MSHPAPGIDVDFEGFRRLASDFFKLSESATFEEVEAGHNCLTLAYLGLGKLTRQQRHEAVTLVHMCNDELDRHNPVVIKGKAAMARLKAFVGEMSLA